MTAALRNSHRELADRIDLLYGSPLDVISSCLRGMIVAPPGKDLIGADFSSIEARVLAWLAGEQGVLDVFRTGQDIYCHAATSIYGFPVNKDDHPSERQVGKVATLALGYQGGVGAFQTMAREYDVEVDDDKAEEIKTAWREAHPKIVRFWWELETAAVWATEKPGQIVECGASNAAVKFKRAGSWLFCRLPSGRSLAYAYPELVPYTWVKWIRGQKKGVKETMPLVDARERENEGRLVIAGDPKKTLTCMGVNSVSRKWERQAMYGGLGVENVTQATARDIMAAAMVRLEARGYPVVLTVHDEVLCEVDAGSGSVDEMESIMCELPPWAHGLPVAAEGWRGVRYGK